MGGEKFPTNGDSVAKQGSPPRGRGKDGYKVSHPNTFRITPAWAGKSPGAESGLSVPRDHPRVGGEKLPIAHFLHHSSGSPPRGRGKAVLPFCSQAIKGITPAWAGKSVQGMHGQE